jgi:dihydroneopterin aldolase
MSGHFNIELKGLRFFAEHGMYAEEVKVGNSFEVDLSVECKAPEKVITSIDQTIDYVEIFSILQEEFSVHRSLLETAAMQIADRVRAKFPGVDKMTITIRKLNPPITNFTGSVNVTYHKTFK